MPEHLPDINLLPSYERQTNTGSRLFFGFIIVIFLLYGVLGFYYFSLKSTLSDEKENVEILTEKADALHANIAQFSNDDATNLADIAHFLEAQDIHTSVFIEEAVDLLPAKSHLNSFSYGGQTAGMSIQFEKMNDVADYTEDVHQSAFTIDTKVNDVTTSYPGESDSVFADDPKYNANFSVELDKQQLKGAEKVDE